MKHLRLLTIGLVATLLGPLTARAADAEADKAPLYKILGILQFAEGKKAEAVKSLAAAIRLDPSTTMRRNEAVDENVLTLFKSLGGRVEADATPVTAERPGPIPADPILDPAFAGEATALEAAARVSQHGGQWAANAEAIVQIDTDATGAVVLVDGILRGSAGDELTVDAGAVVVVLSAPGYLSQTVKFDATAGRKTLRTVQLRKQDLAH